MEVLFCLMCNPLEQTVRLLGDLNQSRFTYGLIGNGST